MIESKKGRKSKEQNSLPNLEDEFDISFFKQQQYECTGFCFCENERATTNILSRGLTYILTSATSLVAFNLAKNHFEKECIIQLSTKCSDDSIKSTVEDCSPSKSLSKKNSEIYHKKLTSSKNEHSNINEEQIDTERSYFCYGNCYPNKLREAEAIDAASRINCFKLRREGIVTVLIKEIYKSKNPGKLFQSMARETFRQDYLLEYCREKSKIEFFFRWNQFSAGKHYPSKVKRKIYGCVSEYHKSKMDVWCIQKDPPMKAVNSKWLKNKWWGDKKQWEQS